MTPRSRRILRVKMGTRAAVEPPGGCRPGGDRSPRIWGVKELSNSPCQGVPEASLKKYKYLMNMVILEERTAPMRFFPVFSLVAGRGAPSGPVLICVQRTLQPVEEVEGLARAELVGAGLAQQRFGLPPQVPSIGRQPFPAINRRP
jgi:hypothetical protein